MNLSNFWQTLRHCNVDKAACISDSFVSVGLRPFHPVLAPTKEYSLDLLFSSLHDVKYEKPLDILSNPDVHHPPALFSFSLKCDNSLDFSVSYKDFRSAIYVNINRELSIINWSHEFLNCDCDTKAEKFYSIINKLIDKYIPTRVSSRNSKFLKWFSKELREFIRKKNEAHWVYKLSEDEDDYIEFKRLRAMCVRKRK